MGALPLMIAFLVKLPVFGVHSWLPKAHVQAPVRGRIFLAAVLLKIGGYGLYFVKPLLILSIEVITLVIVVSVAGSVLSIFYCIILDDMKQVIAYRRVGHIGLVVGTSISDNDFRVLRSLLIIVGHGFTRSLIFYLGNEAYKLTGSRSLTVRKGLISVRPSFCLAMGVVLILNMSFPPSINVFGELSAVMSITSMYPCILVLVFLLVLVGGLFNIKFFLQISHGSNPILMANTGLSRARIVLWVSHLLPFMILPFIMSSI